jgi:hypothetical protein
MKVKSIVALLGLTASVSVFAAPFVPNNPAQSPIGPTPGGEQSLQTIADNLFGVGHVNVATQQSPAAFFSFASASTTSIPTMVAEFTANSSTQSFGIWWGTDTTHFVTYDLLLGPAHAGDNAAISIVGNTLQVGSTDSSACGSRVNCTVPAGFTNSLVNSNSFGFFFRPGGPNTSPTYFSLDQMNTPDPLGRPDRVLAFEDGSTTNWMFAYEDGTDFDYNDMAVKVESINAIPEPETYAMMLAGLGAMGFVSRRRKSR